MIKKTLVGVALLTALVVTPAGTSAQDADDNSLEKKREIYREYTPDNFDDGGPISHYVWKNFPAFFPHAVIARTAPERPLVNELRQSVASFPVTVDGAETTLDAYVHASALIDGMIVLSGGKVVYEAYPRMKAHDRHLGWSVTKVYISTALAALEMQGKVDVDLPVETYVKALARTDWAGISVRNIVNMASGIACLDSDGYQNTSSCIYQYEETLGLTAPHNPPVDTLDLIKSMKRYRTPNTKYEYVSPDTFVSGLVIENVTGQPLTAALQSLIWDHVGAEADGLMMISPKGNAAAHAGLSARLRDVARFGQIFTGSGFGVIDKNHLSDLRSKNGIEFGPEQLFQLKEAWSGDAPTHAAWQWDMIWPDGMMFKGGYSGQGIFVAPEQDIAIAFFGTSDTKGNRHDLLKISRQLSTSGVLDPK